MANKPRIKNITIRGEEYEDVSDICKRLKVSRATVYWRLRRKEPDLIGLKTTLRIRIGDEDYDSVSDCSKKLGVHPNSVYKALDSGKLETLGFRNRKPGAKETKLFAHKWPSRAQVCNDLGISHTTLDKYLSGKAKDSTKKYIRSRYDEWNKKQGAKK